MKDYISLDPWKIVESGFNEEHAKVSESLFSLANGHMGVRGFFEEGYSGESLQGSYFAGIYYPDKTKVGWWKIGYPEYFAKVLNAVNWISLPILVNGELLDLATGTLHYFKRTLDMHKGLLIREFEWASPKGTHIICRFERFCSMHDREIGAIALEVTLPDGDGNILCKPALDFDVRNLDANWDEHFWDLVYQEAKDGYARICATTNKTNYTVASAMCWDCADTVPVSLNPSEQHSCVANDLEFDLKKGQPLKFYKFICNQNSLYHKPEALYDNCLQKVTETSLTGYDDVKASHCIAWENFWGRGDILIEGDDAAQQGIRYNIFQLWQAYQGHDPRLNIGPKGLTGEKYGGSTYWDTEAFCLPFYLGTCNRKVAKNLLLYRYNHLPRAIENAQKLGFKDGAALYPMVTMNGEECHNEWEITFEEIHRNGAIAYAIYDYIRYSGDTGYLLEGGLEVLIAIARFWVQRVNWSGEKNKYVILGVTGPNEYENNINNNWYTNYIARWCIQYTIERIKWVQETHPASWEASSESTAFREEETTHWREIANAIFLPEDADKGIFLQQDDYLDKVQMSAKDLPETERPLNQHWSWDRILRSCFIKQADVLQGLYFFEEHFDKETIRRNFEFYEPKTVHESSLSPCIHAILASRLEMPEKAYEMYLRTARLDLEDYNNDTSDGLHITSMAGTWMAVVKGFAGIRVVNDTLTLCPCLPPHWLTIQFRLHFRDSELEFIVAHHKATIRNLTGTEVLVAAGNRQQSLMAGESTAFDLTQTNQSIRV